MFLKISDQKYKKQHCFLYDSEEVMLRNKQKTMFLCFFWSLIFRNIEKTCFFCLLGDSLEAGGKDKSFSKTRKTFFLYVSEDQRPEKTLFLYDSVDAMLRIIQTTMVVLVFWSLTFRNIFGCRRGEEEFPKYPKNRNNICLYDSVDAMLHGIFTA